MLVKVLEGLMALGIACISSRTKISSLIFMDFPVPCHRQFESNERAVLTDIMENLLSEHSFTGISTEFNKFMFSVP